METMGAKLACWRMRPIGTLSTTGFGELRKATPASLSLALSLPRSLALGRLSLPWNQALTAVAHWIAQGSLSPTGQHLGPAFPLGDNEVRTSGVSPDPPTTHANPSDVPHSCVGVRREKCRCCVILSALLGIVIGVLEVAMAVVVRYFFDEAKETVPKIVPCTLDEPCASDDPSCITCQRDLAELIKLLDNLNEKVDWAVFLLLVLAATQLVRACSGGLFSRFGAGTNTLEEPLLTNSVFSTGQLPQVSSYSWSSRQQQPTVDSVQEDARGQRTREKYTDRAVRNGGARSDFVGDTHATGGGNAAGTGGAGTMRSSFGGRFSDR